MVTWKHYCNMCTKSEIQCIYHLVQPSLEMLVISHHNCSGSVGGEIVVVDTILQSLTQEAPSVTPNAVVDRLKSLLRDSKSKSIVSVPAYA